jgi:hypothetical protein
VALLGLFSSLPASAEVAQKDGVRVSVGGQLSPAKLPRRGSAPVAVSVDGHITATLPGTLPKLETIAIAINSHGKLQNRGIPVCRLGHIDPSTTSEALSACGSSLVGEGRFSADVRIPEQSPFPADGKVLAFNGRLRGKPAVFVHIYGTRPVPTSYVLSFAIRKSHGTFGTILEASLPSVTGEWGYVTGLSLDFKPRFFSASCPAPPDLSRAAFPLLKATFGFEGGPQVGSTLARSCKVKG